jgi:hypothetical protein
MNGASAVRVIIHFFVGIPFADDIFVAAAVSDFAVAPNPQTGRGKSRDRTDVF